VTWQVEKDPAVVVHDTSPERDPSVDLFGEGRFIVSLRYADYELT